MQEIIVIIIIAVVIFLTGRSIIHSFRVLSGKENPCSTCTTDCKIKDLPKNRRQNCEKKKEIKKKSSANS